MTVNSTTRKTALNVGNGVTTSFAFTFKVQSSADIAVFMVEDSVETQVSSADYTVSLNGNQNTNPGGSVVFDTAPVSTQSFIITTDASPTQTQSIQNQASFNPAIVMEALDKLTIQAQQLRNKLNRSVSLPITDEMTAQLETAEERKGKFLFFNATTGAPESAAAADFMTSLDVSENIVTPFGGSTSATLAMQLAYIDRPEHYSNPLGPVGDGAHGYSGVSVATDNTFTNGQALWTSADIGKLFSAEGVGALRYRATTATIAAGGITAAVGDILTIVGGTKEVAAEFRVDQISGGGATGPVTAVSRVNPGQYATLPSNPVSVTSSGSGTGCTLNLSSETVRLPHNTTIASVNNAYSIELTDAPLLSLTSVKFTYGSDNTAALQACINAVGAVYGGGMALRGKIYCYKNLTLPTNQVSGVYFSARNAIVCQFGMAELAACGSGDNSYAVATSRWLTGDPAGAYSGSPWDTTNIVFNACGKERGFVAKEFFGRALNCWFRGATIADVELTRANQDGSDGTTAYQSSNSWLDCNFDGPALFQFRSIGDTTGPVDSSTDADLRGCVFYGRDVAAFGVWLGNGGGWIVANNRFFSHTIAGGYIYHMARGFMWTCNNMDGTESTATPGLIVRAVGFYPDARIGPGNTWYTNLRVDFSPDTTTERVCVRGDQFSTKIAGTPDAKVVHNNNNGNKTIDIRGCVSDADPIYELATGNTLGRVVVRDCTSATAGVYADIDNLLHDASTADGPFRRNVRRGNGATGRVIFHEVFSGEDSGGAVQQYAGLRVQIGSNTAGAESGVIFFDTVNAGTVAARFKLSLGFFAESLTDPGAGNFNALTAFYVNNVKVVGTRKTGWATATGTATRTTFDTATVTTAQLAERVKALIDDLHQTAGHGLIGT